MPRRAARGWLLASILVIAVTAPASAHTDLITTNPTDGKTLSAPPSEVSMRFGEDLLSGGERLVAISPDGQKIPLDASVQGPEVSAAWPAAQSAGTYAVAYRVVAEDGHPLEGRISFTIEGRPSPAVEPVATPSAAPEQTGGTGINVIAPLVFIGALLAAAFFVWRSRAD